MADRNGYIGRAPGDSSVIVARQTFQPTGVQTDFTFSSGYDPGYLDVYLNGSRLIVASDYTATDGSVVGLTSYAENGDVVECVAYKVFNLGSVNNAAGNFDVGIDLTVGNDATITGDLTVSGTTTLGAGSSVSYATTAFNLESGVWTNTDTTAATNTTTGALIVSGGVGIAKSLFVGGNISAGGTVSYEDVTNVDAVGIVTARSGVRVIGGGVTCVGVATFFDDVRIATDNKALYIGEGNDLKIYHDGGHTMMENSTGTLQLGASQVNLLNAARSEYTARFYADGAAELYYDNAKKFETTADGALVGSAITMYASSGIVSATSFYGDGSNLEGVAASGGGVLDITSCLFV